MVFLLHSSLAISTFLNFFYIPLSALLCFPSIFGPFSRFYAVILSYSFRFFFLLFYRFSNGNGCDANRICVRKCASKFDNLKISTSILDGMFLTGKKRLLKIVSLFLSFFLYTHNIPFFLDRDEICLCSSSKNKKREMYKSTNNLLLTKKKIFFFRSVSRSFNICKLIAKNSVYDLKIFVDAQLIS